MQEKDKLNLSIKNNLDKLVDYRKPLVLFIICLSIFFALMVPRLETDPTLRSGIDSTSVAYQQYQQLVANFGIEEFILIAARNPMGWSSSKMLESLQRITREIEELDNVREVISLANLRIFQKQGDVFGNYSVIKTATSSLSLPDAPSLEKIKKALPLTELLISEDLKTMGLLIRVEDQWRYDTVFIKKLLDQINSIMHRNIPSGIDYRIIGPPLIRQAIVKYNIQTGTIFGLLCMLIGTVVSAYVFKSAKITAITNLILGTCVLWILGMMAFLEIPLNSTTALSFGFIPITTLEIVIHIVVRYHQFHKDTPEKISAIKQAVRWLARPCLICTSTTAVGFGTLMISSIPMVKQLGFIMSTGVLISYGLAMILAPAFFIHTKTLDIPEDKGVLRDWMDKVLLRLEQAIFDHHRSFVALGAAITVILFAGTPFIKSDTQILKMLSDKTQEIKDIKFVEDNLTAVQGLELMLQGEDDLFKKPEIWKKVSEMQHRLREIPEVATIDSFLPLLEYLHDQLREPSDGPKDLYSDPLLIPQLLAVTSLSPEGERVAKRFLNSDFNHLHFSIFVRNSPTVPIEETIEKIRATAENVMRDAAKVIVTGELVVVANQTTELISDQIKSMFLAVSLIVILMMIQMESAVLGLICLVPNIPPVAAVFGIMGWFGISLDSVTVFAATVAIGLAVDNTIHFLTQLKREIMLYPYHSTEKLVSNAYRLTAKQILSWTSVTLLGFLALAISPFRPVVFFGILGCCSLILGMFGDLIFIQSLILTSSKIRGTIRRLMEKQVQSEKISIDR